MPEYKLDKRHGACRVCGDGVIQFLFRYPDRVLVQFTCLAGHLNQWQETP